MSILIQMRTLVFHPGLMKERQTAERINRKLRQQLSDYAVPDVMEYVNEKATLYELQKRVKSWERKVEIAEVCARSFLTFF